MRFPSAVLLFVAVGLPAASARAEPAPAKQAAFVHLSAPPRFNLEAQDPDAAEDDWVRVCEAPCDTFLPTNLSYRVIAVDSGKSPTDTFSLKASPGQREVVSLSVDSQSPKSGVVLLAVGITVAMVGVVTFVVDVGQALVCAWGGGSTDSVSACSVNTAAEWVGGIAMAVGGALVISGVLLMASGHRLHQIQTVGALFLQEPLTSTSTAWLPTPVWREYAKEGTADPTRVGIPVFSGRF
jgi:hypothetical protein